MVGVVVFLGGMVKNEMVSSRQVEVSVQIYCYGGDLRGPTTELLSPMAVMLEGLGFNLCVVPFLNVCVLNLTWRVGAEDVGGGWSWVRGVVLESDGRGLRSDHSEDGN